MKPTSTPRRSLIVIGAASSAGAPDPGSAAGPDALRRYRAFHDTPLQHVEWDAILRVPRAQQDTPLQAVAALSARLAAEVEAVLQSGNFPAGGGRRPFLRDRHLERRASCAGRARPDRPDLDRRPHGQPHLRHHAERADSRHAARRAARPRRGGAHCHRRAASQAAPRARMPDRRAQFRGRRGRAAAPAGGAGVRHGRSPAARAGRGVRRCARHRAAAAPQASA